MEKLQILKEVNDVFIDVLENKDIVLVETTTANDVEEWDSLTHIHLVVALEKYFNIRFSSKEIQQWNNVGNMIDDIHLKLNR